MVCAIVPVAYGRTGNFLRCVVRPSGMNFVTWITTDSVLYWRSKRSTRLPSLAIFAGKTFSSPIRLINFSR